jgi:L-threonylcarbamoyladenylate synthase
MILAGSKMKTIMISANEDGAIDLAVEKLIAGELVAVPTETVYGLAADATNEQAVQQIYARKGRPSHNPLICHVSDRTMAETLVKIPKSADAIINKFWPGPLTLVLERQAEANIAPSVTAGLSTLAVRIPATHATRNIIAKLGRPIAAPSANPSGKLSPTSATDVVAAFDGAIAAIMDGGTTNIGIESTIIGVEDNQITVLRPGSISAEMITEVSGMPVIGSTSSKITAPGQLASHYAPSSSVLINQQRTPNMFFVGFGPIDGDLNLSPSGDLNEAAHNLFAMLRRADTLTTGPIAIAPIPQTGVGIAINDRLSRAAAPRDTL